MNKQRAFKKRVLKTEQFFFTILYYLCTCVYRERKLGVHMHILLIALIMKNNLECPNENDTDNILYIYISIIYIIYSSNL